MSLSTNRVMSASMGSQPCLKKAMQMVTMIQNKHDSTVQCIVRVHRPMCSPLLKNVTTYLPPPQTYTFLKWPFLTDFKNIHIPPPPYVMTCLHIAKLGKQSQKVPKRTASECPQEML